MEEFTVVSYPTVSQVVVSKARTLQVLGGCSKPCAGVGLPEHQGCR